MFLVTRKLTPDFPARDTDVASSISRRAQRVTAKHWPQR
jgi:hypothetical protein